MSSGYISIEGAREHNLRNVSVNIPRGKLTVITGLSGSGKSSLAFDTLFAEGQRRYVESLSTYARQFLNQMHKPDVDRIDGLSPAIAIEQRTAGANPRSTVATTTEIHDYLRLLFANVGKQHCPKCGKPVARQSAQEIVEALLQYPSRTRVVLTAPLVRRKRGTFEELIAAVRKRGFVRIRIDGEIHDIDSVPALSPRKLHTIETIVDRLIITNRIRTRLTDSVESALKEGNGELGALVGEAAESTELLQFSERYMCTGCDISFDVLTPRHFSFNSHLGACRKCSGLGTLLVLDERLIIPDPSVSLDDGAIQAWRKGGRRLIVFYKQWLRALAKHYAFDLQTPFDELPEDILKIVMNGSGDEKVDVGHWRSGAYRRKSKVFEGVIPNLNRRYETTASEATRIALRRYMSRRECPGCHGARMRPEIMACTVDGRSIVDVTRLSVLDAHSFFKSCKLSGQEQEIAGEVLLEIRRRLQFMINVGLEYLTLDRESATLSGGEAQRIRLATQIGSGLEGVLYVLDEPSIGLHQRDNERLIALLKKLRDLDNTVVVVEHDEQIIRDADCVVDLGPGAGRLGGEILCVGTVDDLLAHPTSLTARYLRGQNHIHVPTQCKPSTGEALVIRGARENNLRSIDVRFPLGLLVCVTGVSGSGKSTLVDDILRRALFRKIYRSKELPGAHDTIEGMEKVDKVIVIDQSPIGRTPRSNPATYCGAFTHIRKLFSDTPASKIRGFGISRYSFNAKGGRCEKCKGDGLLKLEMHFLPDVYVTCEQCDGLRYNAETLEVRYGGRTIADVLAMTVDEALEFFQAVPTIANRLKTLSEVGLGYIQLGQSATTLSGGEAQRVKLATELSKKATGKTVYLLDEPTTGLHFADIQKLLDVLHRLRDSGNTVIVIEHNLDVIKTADHIIDLGPEGGSGGGAVVVEGRPEEVVACEASHTGRFLKAILK